MTYLAAAAAVTGAVCLLNLLLTFALIRRVREHSERLTRYVPPAFRLPPGSPVQDFTATTLAGQEVSRQKLAGSPVLAGFFSPGCPPCWEQLPEFAEAAKTIPGGPVQVLAVVTPSTGQAGTGRAAEFAARLDGIASVVMENSGGPVSAAFSVKGLPSFYLVDAGGLVESSGPVVRMLGVRERGTIPA